MIHDSTACQLGEGPLWHPERGQLFWFDILGHRLHTKGKHWQFDTHVSAAGWVSHEELLIASARELFLFNLETGASEHVAPLEADNPVTRSNDGRADPWGGFWIGTMGIEAEPGAGAIYRFYKGELRKLYPGITISNAICFAPDRTCAYYADTPTQKIMRQPLGPEGWPDGAPEVFVDLSGTEFNPDGAVVDAEGYLWNAQWGAGRVARYGPGGTFVEAVNFPGCQTSCPAFGGPDLRTIFCTTAAVGLEPDEVQGRTFCAELSVAGQPEHRVIL